jgi:hypothetical protein
VFFAQIGLAYRILPIFFFFILAALEAAAAH